jgi:hypothetical protein
METRIWFSPEDFDETTLEVFHQAWASTPTNAPGDRRRAGLAAALNYMFNLEVTGEVRRDPDERA